jgi:serine/threonine protein kinase
MENSDLLIGKIIDNKYEIIEKIGEGGEATVYKANQTNLDRVVALKIINKSLRDNDDFVNRFIREAKDLAGIEHPNVVRIYDYGKDEDLSYIVMELLNGDTLDKVIHKSVNLGVDQIIRYISPIADALQVIHDKNLIHRDIKSSNIFITNQGRPVLMDFGIAFATNKTVSIHDLRATPQYMSPEHAAGMKLDGRSDLYSLGVVLFECLTGNVPFGGENITVIIQKVINEIPELPAVISKSAPKWLQSLVLVLLNKKPENRIGTAREVHEILQNQRFNETVKTIKKLHQNKTIIAIVVAIGVLLIFVIAALLLPGKETEANNPPMDESQININKDKALKFFNDNNFELSHRFYFRILQYQPDSPEISEKLAICIKNLVSTLFADEFVEIPGSSFFMGNPKGGSDEKPVHEVILNSFKISRFEITNKQYCVFLNAFNCSSNGIINNSQVFIPEINKAIYFSGDIFKVNTEFNEYPVYGVTWSGAFMFCKNFGGRLPTEAEWEYCAKYSESDFRFSGSNNADEIAWYSNNAAGKTHIVGSKMHNWCGVFDMNGNVWEWCFDNYQPAYYSISEKLNPTGPLSGTSKVIRGGDCTSPLNILRCTYRSNATAEGNTGDLIGFRMVVPL